MLFDYKCINCGHIEEYSTSVPSLNPPKDNKCPKCNGLMEKNLLLSLSRQSFDPGRFSYEYEYGKKAWKKNMSMVDQAKVLEGTKDPY